VVDLKEVEVQEVEILVMISVTNVVNVVILQEIADIVEDVVHIVLEEDTVLVEIEEADLVLDPEVQEKEGPEVEVVLVAQRRQEVNLVQDLQENLRERANLPIRKEVEAGKILR